MKFAIFTTAVAVIGSVAALPSALPELTAESAGLQERGTGVYTHLYYCAKKNWQDCQNWRVEKQTCYNIKKFGSKFVRNTGSTGPDAGTFCTFYNVENCGTNEDRLYANYPGYPHLDGHQWDKKAVSFRCW
ncbi:hypothetical protein V8F20_004341 [Naviculisporaceae sp. PSN 640]